MKGIKRLVCVKCGKVASPRRWVSPNDDGWQIVKSTFHSHAVCAECAPVESQRASQQDLIKMLCEENERLRKAGARLAEAAIYVGANYDGLHRLSLAVSEWAKAMADEHGRGDEK